MAKLQDILNITPDFLKEYEGKAIQYGDIYGYVSSTGIKEYTNPAFTQGYSANRGAQQYQVDGKTYYQYDPGRAGSIPNSPISQEQLARAVPFSASSVMTMTDKGGLAPAGKSSYQTADAFRYLNDPFKPERYRTGATQNIDIGFRPRGANEDMASYLQAKQQAEIAQTGQSNIQGSPVADFQSAEAGETDAGDYQYGADVLDKKPNAAAVNTLYQSYFGRDAFTKEGANEVAEWTQSHQTVRALEDFLKEERTKYKITEPIKPIGTVKAEKTEITPDVFKDTGEDNITKSAEQNALLANIQGSFDVNPNLPANTAFIHGVAKLAGRQATPEELAMAGKSISEIAEHFGITGQLKNYGMSGDVKEEGKSKDQTIKDLQAKVESGTALNSTDKENWKYATGGKDYPTAPTPTFDETTGEGEEAPVTGKSALDKKQDLVDNFLSDRKGVREGAKEDEGVDEIQTLRNDAQATADALLTKIEQARIDLEAGDILNTEAGIALKNKLEGQTIPMASINRQLLVESQDLSQAQRLERLYDVYEINSQVNQYNAQLRQVQLYQGQYTEAMDNVKDNVDDWVEMQNLQLNILEEEGKLEKEERARYDSEINYERSLAESGMVHIPDIATHDKLVKDLNVTANTYSNFFYKDPGSPKIYLRPSAGGANNETVNAYVNQIKSGAIKLTSVPSSVRNEVAVALGNYTAPTNNNRIAPEDTTAPFKDVNDLYQRYLSAGYEPSEALKRVKELTGKDIKETNYSASNIPSDLKNEIISNIENKATLQNLIKYYPDISSSYLNSLYNQYTKITDKDVEEDKMTDEEFKSWLGIE